MQLKTELEDGRAGGGHPILTPQVLSCVFFVFCLLSCVLCLFAFFVNCSILVQFPELNLIPGPGILILLSNNLNLT